MNKIQHFTSKIASKVFGQNETPNFSMNESEEKFRTLIEFAPDAFFHGDSKGDFITVNDKACELSGFSREELLSMNMASLFPANVIADKPLRYDLLKQGETIKSEREIRRKTGEKIMVEMNSRVMPDKTYQSFIRDITERKKAEEDTRISEARLKRAELASKSGNWELHLDTQTIIASEGAMKLYGVEKDHFDYELIKMVPLPEYRPLLDSALKNLISENEPYDVEFKIKSIDTGEIKDIRSIGTFDREKRILFGIIQDITRYKMVAKSLNESEHRFRKLVEHAPITMAIVGMDGAIEFINHKATEVFGYLPVDIPTMESWWIQAYPDELYRNEVVADWMGRVQKAILEGAEIHGNEYYVTCKDGTVKIVFISGVPVTGKIFVLFEDITQRRQAEEKLRESEERYRVFINSTDDMAFLKDDQFRYILVNQSNAAFFGIKEAEAIGKTDFELMPEKSAQLCRDSDKSVFSADVVIVNEEQVGDRIYETHKFKVPLNNGKYGVGGYIRDTTDRKHAEMEVHKAKEKAESSATLIRNITDNIPAFIAVVDANTLIYKFVNQKFITGFKKKREEIVGAHISDVIGEPNTAFAMKYIDEVRQGKISSYINTFEIAEGKRYINVNYVPGFNDKGEVTEIITLSFDVTSIKESEQELQKAKEKAEESDRLKSAFLQNMSHEIRTPMNAIMGFSSILTEYYNNKPKLEQFSQIINRRCNDLLEIINGILDISKIESGQLPIHFEECNLHELFTELTTFFKEHQKRIEKLQIGFSLQTLTDPSENIIITDKVKLKQIFINLIGNAFKFTDTGKIEGGCKFDANRNLVFYVSDTGIGIPPNKHDIIFERFSQLEQNNKEVYGGTGLGLPIVKGLIGLLGGKIWLESEPGKGTAFFFSFPYKISQSTLGEPALEVENPTYHFPGRTILVVEDDQYNARYIHEILSKTGINILHTRYGNEAVQIALSQSIDLVLMDIRLPDIDGYEATRKIRQQKPNLKVIAQTAYAAQEDKQKAFAAGCDDYISKPINRDLLLSIINKQLP